MLLEKLWLLNLIMYRLTGKGIKVGIIDTGNAFNTLSCATHISTVYLYLCNVIGIDYTHPALGGCFGPLCRVAFGHDFVGDNYDGTNENTEGPDPRDICNGHGTHVAGKLSACLR
jgi:minor extracellular serine protease Vpr